MVHPHDLKSCITNCNVSYCIFKSVCIAVFFQSHFYTVLWDKANPPLLLLVFLTTLFMWKFPFDKTDTFSQMLSSSFSLSQVLTSSIKSIFSSNMQLNTANYLHFSDLTIAFVYSIYIEFLFSNPCALSWKDVFATAISLFVLTSLPINHTLLSLPQCFFSCFFFVILNF